MREGEGEAREVALENGGYTFTMPDANVFFTAETEKLPLYRLTSYSVNDTAMGSVFPSAEAKNGWYEGESATLAVSPGGRLCDQKCVDQRRVRNVRVGGKGRVLLSLAGGRGRGILRGI